MPLGGEQQTESLGDCLELSFSTYRSAPEPSQSREGGGAVKAVLVPKVSKTHPLFVHILYKE